MIDGHFGRMRALSALLLAVVAGGCGNDAHRFAVSGNVTINGQPIPVGFVKFEPNAAKGNRGPAAGGQITDGQYAIPAERGMVGGPHIVTINASDGIATTIDGEAAPQGKPILVNFKTEIDLPAEDTQWTFDVPPADPSAR